MRRILSCLLVVLLIAALPIAQRTHGGGGRRDAKGSKKIIRIDGELKANDPVDALTKAPSNVHLVSLVAGKVYKLEMRADDSDLAPLLRLEDPKGSKIALAYGNPRILYEAPTDGKYRVIATAYPAKKEATTGKYIVTVEPINWKRYLNAELKPLADKGADATAQDAAQVMKLAMNLEATSATLAADAYTKAGALLAKATNAQAQRIGKLMEGAARRVQLVGQPIDVHGRTLAGKEFDWKAYKGKVVLVDFWATWCGPCRREIPNIKKLYTKYHKRGFDVVAVSIDDGKDAPTKFMEKEELPWICLHDPSVDKGKAQLTEYYGIFGIPQAILVGRDGRVVSLEARGDDLRELLETLIDKGAKASK